MKPRIIRTSTISMSLDILLKGQLAFLNKFYEVVAVSGMDDHLEKVALREKVRTENVPMSREISLFKDFVSLVRLYMLFKRERPLLVHSVTPKAGLLSMSAAYFAGVPIRVHTFTGLIFPYKKGFLHLLLLLMDKMLCRVSTHVIPEGEGVRKDLLKYRVTSKPLKVLGNGNVNGIDVNYFHANNILEHQKQTLKRDLKIGESNFVFIFVGRMVSDKGVNELIRAFSNLKTTESVCKLILVGPFENDLDPLNDVSLGIIESNKNIVSVGFQEDVRTYLSIADVFVFPSYREGFPNVVLQAGAMDLPCIVTDISGSNEIIKQNINGTIIPIKDSNALLNNMQLMIDNDEFRVSLKQNARQLIVSRYEQNLVWNALLEKYREITNNV